MNKPAKRDRGRKRRVGRRTDRPTDVRADGEREKGRRTVAGLRGVEDRAQGLGRARGHGGAGR